MLFELNNQKLFVTFKIIEIYKSFLIINYSFNTIQMGDQDDSFSNPIVPVNVASPVIKTVEVERQNLSNEDFRKLLMTPRTGSASGPPSSRVLGSVRSHRKPILNDQFKIPSTVASSKATEPGSDSKERKAKKKSNHSVKTDTDDTL